MTVDLQAVTAYLHEHIPLTAHLGARVSAYDGRAVTLDAPLAPNLNHRNTAFGGSLSALAILSGWTLLHLRLKELGICNRLVIQKSSFDYSEPVDADFQATCEMPPQVSWEKFLKTLERHGRARLTLASTLSCSNGTGGTHLGTYVAVRLADDQVPATDTFSNF